ncbi:MAG: 5-bromo-4-chloroindolyl phosphate hydrolysis family protein [Oscillospiraceae bacterium]|jgi:hypothetical protein|nr:5-bromo-4-chloroindolyl phosphate hydrolysis family protein [Oscillospiraceae bacterium]
MMKKEIRKKSAAPFYAVAAVFVIWGFFLPLYLPLHFILLFIIAAAAYTVFSRLFPGTVTIVELDAPPVRTGDEKLDELMARGAVTVREMREICAAVSDAELSAKIGELARITDLIFRDLAEDAEDYRAVRRFSELYLPTVMKLLRTYRDFARGGGEGENVTETMSRISGALDSITASFRRQHDALFQNQALDIETDITVLENLLKSEKLQ